MLKKLSIFLLVFSMIFAMSSCGASDQADENATDTGNEASEPAVGEWELYYSEANAEPLPEYVQKAFDKARETFDGSAPVPVAYIASQVVAGKNYMILCETATKEAEPEISYQMVVVYEDLEGNAEITQVNDFDVLAYVEGGDAEVSAEKLAGGWEAAEDLGTVVVPQEARDVFDKIAVNVGENRLELMALLGTQAVAGTNYAFLCRNTVQAEETINSIQVVTVHSAPDGDAEITNTRTVDPADFNK